MRYFRAVLCTFVCSLVLVSAVSIATGQPAAARPAASPMNWIGAINRLQFREIGPATMGGRVNDIEVHPNDARVIYAATASAGILKSVNGGHSWDTLFDGEAVSSVGDVAISPSNPAIVWAGTGESNNRQSSSWGNGVYKSLDGGKTWKHMGLTNTMAIARVVIHPTNPDIVYVAATGNLWGPNPERGVFKTTDGGRSWQHVLKVNDDTGATELAIDIESPNILYAAMYQRRRSVFGFNGSGPHSALYRSNDGGDTWTKVTRGMPYDTENAPNPRSESLLETGRISISVYPRDTNIVYVTVEHADGGVYRSMNKGETWTRMAPIASVPRPMYFSKLRVDPNNDQRLWLAGVAMQYSEDGGRTWTGQFSQAPHADTHGIWINPRDSNHLIQGNDGGINVTYDRGRTWDHMNTVPLGQFYEIGADNGMPYKICGGLQDNNSWCGPSMSMNPQGIRNDDWWTVSGGDGFYVQPDPHDSDIVYTESQDGNVSRRNVRTGESKSIRPREDDGEKNFRFQWNSPIVISTHAKDTIYFGGNFLFKSTNRGDTWTKVGNVDLTTGAIRNEMPIMGKVPDRFTRSRHDGVQNFPTISTVAESPVNKDVLWVGTDDGNLQVTRNGQTWKNVADKLPGVPKGTYISRVIASKSGEGAAYVTLDGHRNGDFKVYIFSTTDFGENWRSIVNNIPQNNGVANVIREHPRNPNLLFVGTEFGLWVSYNRGGNWIHFKANLPTVPIDDILIHPRENDLILGTHGRSIWIMDDISALEQLNDNVLQQPIAFFEPRQGVMWRTWGNKPVTSDKVFNGQNPPNGAMINFYLREPLAQGQTVNITITDSAGQVMRTQNCTRPNPNQQQGGGPGGGGPFGGGGGGGGGQFGFGGGGGGNQCIANQGVNRWVWDMRYRPAGLPAAGPGGGGPGGGGGGGGFGGGGLANLGFRVDPGDYVVKVRFGSTEITKPLKVIEDPRIQFSADDRAKKKAALARLLPIAVRGTQAQQAIVQLRQRVNAQLEAWRAPGAPRIPDNIRQAAEALLAKIDKEYVNWGTPPSPVANLSAAGPPLVENPQPISQRATMVLQAMEGTSGPPTEWELSQIDWLSRKIPPAADAVRSLITVDLAALNNMIIEAKIPLIQPPNMGGPGPGGPPNNENYFEGWDN